MRTFQKATALSRVSASTATRRLVAAVEAGDDGGEDAGDAELLGADVGAVGGQHGEDDDQAGVGLAADDEDREEADGEADGDAAERDGDELERRVAEREGAAGGDAERRSGRGPGRCRR